MRKLTTLFCLTLALSCQMQTTFAQPTTTRVCWDKWGVPHIYARNETDLFFAQGWAQMHSHGNLILSCYGKSRGKASSYWGRSYLDNDILINTLEFPQIVEAWKERQSPELRAHLASFVKGMNSYARQYPEKIDFDKRAVLPLTIEDVNLQYLNTIYAKFIAGEEIDNITWGGNLGSNAMAIAPSNTTTHNAMLVQNPHLPWSEDLLLWESHLNLPKSNIYGVTLVGLPAVLIGFNENLGWTHTVNTVHNVDTYKIKLKNQGYILDGKEQVLLKRSVSLRIKNRDSTIKDTTIMLFKTKHGPILKSENNTALAIRIAGLDLPNGILQWWKMAKSENFSEFKSALKLMEIPLFNIIYADKRGDIFYFYNGAIPNRSSEITDTLGNIIPGDNSRFIWNTTLKYKELPKLRNPNQGWIQNSNDPPWTCTIPQVLRSKKYPGIPKDNLMSLRSQKIASLLSKEKLISFDNLIDYKLSTRLESADRLMNELLLTITDSDTSILQEAKSVLKNWDRSTDNSSEGAVLFTSWIDKMDIDNPGNFVENWNPEHPLVTPSGLKNPAKAKKNLLQAAVEVLAKYGKLNIPWGDVVRIRYGDFDLPANGAPDRFGIVRVSWFSMGKDTRYTVNGGDSWVGVIEFGPRLHAKVLLSYGNSTQNNSPHKGDQLTLYSEKKLRDAWFYSDDVEAHCDYKMELRNGLFEMVN